MTIESAAARWLLTAVFVAAALAAVLSRGRRGERGQRGGPARPDWAETAFCLVMCAALIAMAWWTEPGAVVLQP